MPFMSPEVQAYGQQPSADQAEDLFKERFSSDAYAVLFAKFADLAPQVVTFKILETDLDTGKAVGTFIILQDDRPIYVPVVMIDSQLKPLDMFYYKELNIFLPLTNAWLEEISKMNLNEMGAGQEIPNEVPRDVNIRDLVMPPQTTTGRVGLASDMEHTAQSLYKEAEDQTLEVHPAFMRVIRNSPKVVLDGIKIAFERHPKFLQKVAHLYGVTELQNAFQEGYRKASFSNLLQEKVAQAENGKLRVLTKTASPDAIREVFGEQAGAAFSTILKYGYVYKDARPTINKAAVKVEGEAVLQSPGPSTAWYRLFFIDAPAGDYFVVPFPKESEGSYCVASDRYYHTYGDKHKDIEYLVIKADGTEAWTEKNVMGIPLENEDKVKGTKVWNLLQNKGGTAPVANSYGYFIYNGTKGVQATKPVRIGEVVTTGGRTKYIGQYGDGNYIKDDDPTRNTIDVTMNSQLVFLPKNSQWMELARKKGENDNDWDSWSRLKNLKHESIIKDPKLMMRWLNAKLHESGARPANVKKAAADRWWVENDSLSLLYPQALQKVANEYGISIEDANGILKDAQKHGRSYSFIIDKTSGRFMKTAMDKWAQPPMQGPMGAEMPPGQAMPPGGAMPPNMAPPIESEMPMAPTQSPMSATDLAIAETVKNLQHQTDLQMQQMQDQMMQQQQAMDQQVQMNQQLIGALEQIQGRAQEINAATGGVIPAGAEQSPAEAAQMLAPAPPPEPGPPPTPVMSEDTTSPEMIADQINPELMEQAGELNDQGVFDTAAIATLAAAPVLQDVVSAYIPNLEKGVDNLGRVLLTLWMKEPETKETIGDEAFTEMEDKLRTVFKNLGEAVIMINQNAVTAQQGLDQIQIMADQQ